MNCLDTYALWEIQYQNTKFADIINNPFIITDWTLIEFYKTLLKEYDKKTAMYWVKQFLPHTREAKFEILVNAVDFQEENKGENLSLFDCVGYVFSLANNHTFVTGDKAFKNKKNVIFISK